MIVIPMAGFSSRFFKAGYNIPKFMLDLHGRPVFDFVLASFANYWSRERFLFIMREDYDTPHFVRERVDRLGLSAQFVILDDATKGQAHTVELGLDIAEISQDRPITIFNIDSFRPDFHMSAEEYNSEAYIEVFRGSGENWSFIQPIQPGKSKGLVNKVAEKCKISDLCSTGLYHFSSVQRFKSAYRCERLRPSQNIAEHYIAPIYNQLISAGHKVSYRVIPKQEVIFCGEPTEYLDLKSNPSILEPLQKVLSERESLICHED